MFGIWIANINLVNFMDTDLKYVCQGQFLEMKAK